MASKRSSEMQNLLLALVASMLIMSYWQYFIEAPRKKAEATALKAQTQSDVQLKKDESDLPTVPRSRPELLAESKRVHINSNHLHGSIALTGLRFDDLTLAHYQETLDPKSPEVTLLSPAGDAASYFAEFGWLSAGGVKVPDAQSVWSADSDTLTPEKPVTLSWNNGAGVTFHSKIALDEKYLFTLTQWAQDASGKKIELQNYAYLNRIYDIKAHPAINILHEGPIGVFDGQLQESPYKKLSSEKEQSHPANNGWLGVSDKYWLTAIVPPNDAQFNAKFSYYVSKGRDRFQVEYAGAAAPETTLHFFAGAKELGVLQGYEQQYNIPLFDRAVDFGTLYFLTKPIFLTLTYFHALVGNFGLAIMLLTVLVKLLMFPLANKSFKAMSQMKNLQPKIKELQERNKDDKLKLNQEMMALYKREKVNPASGCLPVFIQIPVFFALYKVLYVTIEMRHAPFFGWIHDLSAPDPTNLFTLFGLIPWAPPAMLHLGIWPIVMCLTMFIQQSQSPPPPDPMQAKVMKLMPLFFLFLFSSFPAGLVIYWSWSNTLTILQQAYIANKHKPRNL